jgi:hypothetical protein
MNADATPELPDLDEIVDKIDALFSDMDVWVHRRTGEVYWMSPGLEGEMPEEDAEIERMLESDELVYVEAHTDDGRRVEDYLARLEDVDVARRVAGAWNRRGRGRWHRFKTALAGAGLLDDWNEFRLARLRDNVAAELEDEGVRFHDRRARR